MLFPRNSGSQSNWASALLVAFWISGALLHAVDPCARPPFQGFDSRLQIQYLGRVPITSEPIVGFELLNGRPIVAYPHSVIAIDHRHALQYRTPEQIVAIAADAAGALWLQTAPGLGQAAPGLFLLQKAGFVRDSNLTVLENSVFYDSGNPAFLELARGSESAKLFVVRRQDGVKAYLAPVRGTIHAISWNQAGLAAVVEAGVYVWRAGSNDLVRLGLDTGFSKARDVTLVGPERAVLALQNYVVLISRSGQTVVVGFKARCRFMDGVLYLLDERGGFLWALRGIEKLGHSDSDKDYARHLIQSNPGNATETSSRYLEAVRLVGCTQAKELRAEILKNGGPPVTIRDVRAGTSEPVHELTEQGMIAPRRLSTASISESGATAKLELVIGADGAVRSGTVLTTPAKQVGDDALAQARTWRYDPALKDGRPVAVRLVESATVQTPAGVTTAAGGADAQKYFEQGQGLVRRGKFVEAVALFDKALAADPHFAEAYYQKGLALVASSTVGPGGKTVVQPGAVEALQRYVQLSPGGEHAQAAREMLESISQ